MEYNTSGVTAVVRGQDDTGVDLSFEKLTLNQYHSALCIDIGIQHLGFVGIEYDDEYRFKKILGIDMIDITQFHHPDGICRDTCHLYHTKTFADWMDHVFYKYDNIFEGVDTIVIERQPPMGLTVIEQLIFYKWRNKSVLVSPNSMHKHFNIGHMTYERRKEATMNIMQYYLSFVNTEDILNEYYSFERKHDIADALCLGVYWLAKMNADCREKQRLEEDRLLREKSKMIVDSKNLQEYRATYKYPLYVRI